MLIFHFNNFLWLVVQQQINPTTACNTCRLLCLGFFRAPEEDPENTVAACSLVQLSRNASHTQYICTVDMTELLADTKVQVDVTDTADRQHVLSKEFYLSDNSKYKNSEFPKYPLTSCARIVWTRGDSGSKQCGTMLAVHSSTESTVLLLLLLCLKLSFKLACSMLFVWKFLFPMKQ